MQSLLAKKRPVDFVALLTMMEPVELGGANYLAELAHFASPTKFDRYVDMMREAWKNREKNKILIQAKEGDWEIGSINCLCACATKNNQQFTQLHKKSIEIR